MPYYTLNRDHALASTLGLSVNLKKDVATYVPDPLVPEVIALGGEEVADPAGSGDIQGDTTRRGGDDAGYGAGGTDAPSDPKERERQLRGAIEAVTLRNHRDDFNAGGKPNIKPLADELGWTPSASERDHVLAKIANGQ